MSTRRIASQHAVPRDEGNVTHGIPLRQSHEPYERGGHVARPRSGVRRRRAPRPSSRRSDESVSTRSTSTSKVRRSAARPHGGAALRSSTRALRSSCPGSGLHSTIGTRGDERLGGAQSARFGDEHVARRACSRRRCPRNAGRESDTPGAPAARPRAAAPLADPAGQRRPRRAATERRRARRASSLQRRDAQASAHHAARRAGLAAGSSRSRNARRDSLDGANAAGIGMPADERSRSGRMPRAIIAARIDSVGDDVAVDVIVNPEAVNGKIRDDADDRRGVGVGALVLRHRAARERVRADDDVGTLAAASSSRKFRAVN